MRGLFIICIYFDYIKQQIEICDKKRRKRMKLNYKLFNYVKVVT